MNLGPIIGHSALNGHVSLCQVKLTYAIEGHFSEKGRGFVLCKLFELTFYLIASHRVVLLHKPGLVLVLLPKGLCVLLFVLGDICLVLALELVEITTRLHARELLEGDKRLAHLRPVAFIRVLIASITAASAPSTVIAVASATLAVAARPTAHRSNVSASRVHATSASTAIEATSISLLARVAGASAVMASAYGHVTVAVTSTLNAVVEAWHCLVLIAVHTSIVNPVVVIRLS